MNLPLTIKETQDGLFNKDFSAVELTDLYLERIKKYNSKLNAILTVCSEDAYIQAKEIDRIVGSHDKTILKEKPLLGVTVAHKDILLTKGVRTTAGSKLLESFVPKYSGTVVTKMNNAGAIQLGKTNMDAWAMGSSGEHSDFGPTINPWNLDCVPGGTSSGSATAESAGLSLITTGTDTGGSIRQPANFCGVVGIKPTYGAVSRYGVIAAASSLDTVGNFALTVEDCETVFNSIKGTDNLDSNVVDFDLMPVKDKIVIGIPNEYFIDGLDKEIEISIFEAINTFKKLKVEFKNIDLKTTKYTVPTFYVINPAEYSSNLGRYDGVRYGGKRSDFGDEAKRRIMLGTYVLSAGYYDAYYLKAMKARSLIVKDFIDAFEKVDAIIAPVSPTLPFKINEKVDDPLKMYLADVFTVSANLAGIPGLAVPCGFSKKGLPLGFQLLGPRFSENLLFNLGKMYQKNTNFKPLIAEL